MIRVESLSFQYPNSKAPAISEANFEVAAGELVVLCGPTGSGKSTLLKLLNGLLPRYGNGEVSGRVIVDGVDVFGVHPSDLAPVVGYVHQQAEDSFVAQTVEEEIAFALEQQGVAPHLMQSRIEAVARRFEIENLLGRKIEQLSGGQQQRVGIAAAMVHEPRILLLDEPTSELDDLAAASLLQLLREIATEHRVCVLMAEHRLDRVFKFADSAIVLLPGGQVTKNEMPDGSKVAVSANLAGGYANRAVQIERSGQDEVPILKATGISAGYRGRAVLESFDFELHAGELVGVYGKNGSGKSTLLRAVAGDLPLAGGSVERLATLRLVPQNASDLLFLDSVAGELSFLESTDSDAAARAADIFARLIGEFDPARHPRDLSAGQQLALALALQLAAEPEILLLDEPTRGLDHPARLALAELLLALKAEGTAIVLASHDRDFVDAIADRVVMLDA